uniref:peroxidase n=1 Tax=Tanacetum cinerariifolium TaxID=118510 RepID=A0A6L2J3X9_TANCI|nr:peroxidase 60-like [Tanacetum cinerariifolium]
MSPEKISLGSFPFQFILGDMSPGIGIPATSRPERLGFIVGDSSKYGSNSKKTAPPNLSVRGNDVIDAAKSEVERACPGVVSCADIIDMATRDAVSFSGGGRYVVQTGRRDGSVSVAQTAAILSSSSVLVSNAITAFASKGLNATDMVYFLGNSPL